MAPFRPTTGCSAAGAGARLALGALAASALLAAADPAAAQASADADDLAKKLSNPVANLISVPFQNNLDSGIGPLRKGSRYTLNIQPVIPFKLNDDWNLISRTIIPIVSQRDIFPGAGSQSGLGDTVQSLFLSPNAVGPGGLVWGAGPVFLLPTGTHDFLSTRQWGAGPTAVGLVQQGPWTIGALANHIWSFAETKPGATRVSASLLNPFITYTTPDKWTFGLSADATYNWVTHRWSMPVLATVSKLVVVDKQPISFTLGLRHHVVTTPGGPKGWGARASVVFLFPT